LWYVLQKKRRRKNNEKGNGMGMGMCCGQGRWRGCWREEEEEGLLDIPGDLFDVLFLLLFSRV
jgi:hypothetical protein